MRAVSAVRLVAVRELRERGRSKAFWAGTIVLLVGVVAATIVPAMLGHHGPRTPQVGWRHRSSPTRQPWGEEPMSGPWDRPYRPAPRWPHRRSISWLKARPRF